MSDLFMADDKGWHEPYQKAMDLLLEMKMLVPVERCEPNWQRISEIVEEAGAHGIDATMERIKAEWCPGAGIGDTDECPNGCDPGCQCHD